MDNVTLSHHRLLVYKLSVQISTHCMSYSAIAIIKSHARFEQTKVWHVYSVYMYKHYDTCDPPQNMVSLSR